uniref:Uncharacterized protein n=1 Tax=Steinernema glaseri TaxID=37863 RepID=A0A1I7ZUA4_9BILA
MNDPFPATAPQKGIADGGRRRSPLITPLRSFAASVRRSGFARGVFCLRHHVLQHRRFSFALTATSSNSSSIPFSSVLSAEDLLEASLERYTEPLPRSSQLQLDKNAEPPWDPDPRLR